MDKRLPIAHAARDERGNWRADGTPPKSGNTIVCDMLPPQAGSHNMTTSTGHKESAMNINAAEFKAKCLKLIDEVAATHEPLVITKRGKPVARVVPIEDEAPTPGLFGYMKGTGKIVGDIVNVPREPWAAETGEEDHLYLPVNPQDDKS